MCCMVGFWWCVFLVDFIKMLLRRVFKFGRRRVRSMMIIGRFFIFFWILRILVVIIRLLFVLICSLERVVLFGLFSKICIWIFYVVCKLFLLRLYRLWWSKRVVSFFLLRLLIFFGRFIILIRIFVLILLIIILILIVLFFLYFWFLVRFRILRI